MGVQQLNQLRNTILSKIQHREMNTVIFEMLDRTGGGCLGRDMVSLGIILSADSFRRCLDLVHSATVGSLLI
jgi:hypothetical protein